ncbi:MAG: tetratricopeptide repeat protein [Luteibaculaceae bacterium]
MEPYFLKNTLHKATIILVMVAFCMPSFGQKLKSVSFMQDYKEATLLMENGKYDKAKSIWQKILRDDPENGNINYKLGFCYLQSEFYKPFALKSLIKAEQNIGRNYDPFNELERGAPRETYYYLGLAYHLNEDFDNAIKFYTKATKNLHPKHVVANDLRGNLKKANFAKQAYTKPLKVELSKPAMLNSRFKDLYPILHPSGESILFASNKIRLDSSNLNLFNKINGERYSDIYLSNKDRKGNWKSPIRQATEREVNSYPIQLVNDTILTFYNEIAEKREIFKRKISRNESEIDARQYGILLPPGLNTTQFCLSPTKKTVYYSAYSKNSKGGSDLYFSTFEDNSWSNPKPITAANSTKDEINPTLSPDGSKLFFASNGHEDINMGGFDLFYIELNKEGIPLQGIHNFGYPINTVLDELSISCNFLFTEFAFTSNRNKINQYEIFLGEFSNPLFESPTIKHQIKLFVEHDKAGLRNKNLPELTTTQDTFRIPLFNPNLLYAVVPVDATLALQFGSTEKQSISTSEHFSACLFLNHDEKNYVLTEENLRFWHWEIENSAEALLNDLALKVNNISIPDYGKSIFPHFIAKGNQTISANITGINPNLGNNLTLVLKNELDEIILELSHSKNCTFLPAEPSALAPLLKQVQSTAYKSENKTESKIENSGVSLSFFQGFSKNAKAASMEQAMFKSFIYELSELLNQNLVQEIVVVGSASKLPTARYESNEQLAHERANNLKEAIQNAILEILKEVDPPNFKTSSVVQGPEYTPNSKIDLATFEKYQFAKAEVILVKPKITDN